MRFVFTVATYTLVRALALSFKTGFRQTGNASFDHVEDNTTKELVLMHIPFNFGHTLEKLALVGDEKSREEVEGYIWQLGGFGGGLRQQKWSEVNKIAKEGGVAWGHFNPDLQVMSEVTGCALFYTPPKYWPEDVAKKYFGDKVSFGLLRDPYERLVAEFRGNVPEYGDDDDTDFMERCDVDGAVRAKMEDHLAKGNKFGNACTLIQQTEYFEGPYGAKLAVDVRRFPEGMNKVLEDFGYKGEDWHIDKEAIIHVTGPCDHVWAGNLSAATKALVRKAFPDDFRLLCEKFGYCDEGEDTCIRGVPDMCPHYICPECPRGGWAMSFNMFSPPVEQWGAAEEAIQTVPREPKVRRHSGAASTGVGSRGDAEGSAEEAATAPGEVGEVRKKSVEAADNWEDMEVEEESSDEEMQIEEEPSDEDESTSADSSGGSTGAAEEEASAVTESGDDTEDPEDEAASTGAETGGGRQDVAEVPESRPAGPPPASNLPWPLNVGEAW